MADINEITKKLEEERIKKAEDELKLIQEDKARQERLELEREKVAKIQQNVENAKREQILQQEKLEELNRKLENSSNEKMTNSLKQSIAKQQELITKTQEELKRRTVALNQSNSNTAFLNRQEKTLADLKEKQIKSQKDALEGINKALKGVNEKSEALSKESSVDLSLTAAVLGGVGIEPTMFEKIAGFLFSGKDENKNEPTPVKVTDQPSPERDTFAEEKQKEAQKVQIDQSQTQERIADGIEKLVDGSVEVKGKDTGLFSKILSGEFNPLTAIQGIVTGIFGIIESFITGIGSIIKSALGVLQGLVQGIGNILLTIVDIVGKGFVKIMGFAGKGIAALFKALGSIPPQALLIGAAAIGVLTLAFMGLGKGLQMITPAIKELATIPISNFLELAGGLAVLAVPLTAFGVAAAVATPGILGLSLGVGALGLALRVLAPAIETIIPPMTDMLGSFGEFLSTLQIIVSNFFTTIGEFITTAGTVLSNFITSFAQSLVLLNDADFLHLAGGFVALGASLAGFGVISAVAIPALVALGKASSGLADLINAPPDRLDALRESFKLLGKAVKEFAKDAKGLGGAVVSMGALSVMPFAKKLLDVQLAKTETRDVIDNFKGGVAEAIQPVDIVSFSGSRTDRAVEMLQRASETSEIRDDSTISALSTQNITTVATNTNAVTQNTVVIPDSPFDKQFQASSGAF